MATVADSRIVAGYDAVAPSRSVLSGLRGDTLLPRYSWRDDQGRLSLRGSGAADISGRSVRSRHHARCDGAPLRLGDGLPRDRPDPGPRRRTPLHHAEVSRVETERGSGKAAPGRDRAPARARVQIG